MKITKAIIPVAGYGTRRLPITKAIEKSMLPVGNQPVIDYIVQDCIKAGITDFYFVVGEQSEQLRTFYGHNQALEDHLHRHNKTRFLEQIQPPTDCRFTYVVQPPDPYGTAVPVGLMNDVVAEDEKVLVIMGDQFMYHADGGSEAAWFLQQAEAAQTPLAMLAVEVPHAEVSKYGIVATRREGEHELYEHIIEKPTPEEAPTNLNNASFYLFDKGIFNKVAEYMQRSRDGEYFVTDPINEYVAEGHAMTVIRAKGQYLDCGTLEGWLHANQVVCGS